MSLFEADLNHLNSYIFEEHPNTVEKFRELDTIKLIRLARDVYEEIISHEIKTKFYFAGDIFNSGPFNIISLPKQEENFVYNYCEKSVLEIPSSFDHWIVTKLRVIKNSFWIEKLDENETYIELFDPITHSRVYFHKINYSDRTTKRNFEKNYRETELVKLSSEFYKLMKLRSQASITDAPPAILKILQKQISIIDDELFEIKMKMGLIL